MAWYTKDYSYPVPRWKFPFRLKDENGKSYTGENAFNNRAKLGWTDVENPPIIDSDTQRMYWSGVEWVVDPIPESEFLAANTAAWVRIRSSRDDALQNSDWTQIKISETEFGYTDNVIDANTSVQWATYRQELRDLPSTTANAHAIVWPIYPGAAE
jgi:hypothetical protein